MNVSKHGFRGFWRYLDHLTYSYRRERKHDSEPTRWLTEHISDDVLDALTPGQHDRLERTVSAVLGALRVGLLVRQGWTLRPWRPTNARQPAVRRGDGYGSRFFEWDPRHTGWIDHPYRITTRAPDGALIERFIAEPYNLNADDLRALAKLADEGWSVTVDADWSLRYPGSTVRVVISRKEDR